jgi:hypothetical protein
MSSEIKILTKIAMIESGIIPAFTAEDLSKMLMSLSEKEKREKKRKFRKLWKKILKKDPSLKNLFCPSVGTIPTRSNLRNRSVFVTSCMLKNGI